MTAAFRAVCGTFLLSLTPAAYAQSITTEAAFNAGYSTDDVAAAAVQVRAFGDLRGGVHYFGEASWANTSDHGSDSFGAAYPYANRVQVIEAYAERTFRPAAGIFSVRAGRFRTPFGISGGSDHAYTGFLRAPLIRYDPELTLSNTFLENGVDLVGGVPHLTAEVALGAPGDVGVDVRRSGLDAIFRIQGYYGPFIVGVSHSRESPAGFDDEAPGRAHYSGVDIRWMYNGVLLRGEWMTGQPFDGASTRGWYADLLLHRTFMGPVTFVARLERLDVDSSDAEYTEAARRQIIGARIRMREALALTVNVQHRTSHSDEYPPAGVDIGLSWSLRRP